MPAPPRRRWLQFSLRATLCGVTAMAMLSAACVWLRREIGVVNERIAFRRWVETHGGFSRSPADPLFDPNDERLAAAVRITKWRVWLGDEAIFDFGLPAAYSSADETAIAKQLFPEAIYVFGMPREPWRE